MTIWDLLVKGLPLREVLVSFSPRASVILLFIGGFVGLLYVVNGLGVPGTLTRPYWIEISDKLSYKNRRGISHVDWADVRSMHFEYAHIYESDDPLPHDAYNTYLIITLASDQRLNVGVGSYGS